jgi:hypothetical protein
MDEDVRFNRLYDIVIGLVKRDPKVKVTTGDSVAMDTDKAVVYTSKIPLGDKKRIEVAYTTPEARPAFEWLAEITIDELEYQHFLLRSDRTIVETYGHNVMPVDDAKAQQVLDRLTEIEKAEQD